MSEYCATRHHRHPADPHSRWWLESFAATVPFATDISPSAACPEVPGRLARAASRVAGLWQWRRSGARIRRVAVFRHEIVLPACSREWLEQFIAAVHDKAEALRFDGGRLAEQPPDGQEVLLVAGRHARKGAEYQVGPEATGSRITITAWDRARETGVRALTRDQGAIITTSAKLRSANRPEVIEIHGEYRNPHGPWLARRAGWRAKVSLKGWWEYLLASKGPAPAVAEMTHPLLRGKLELYPRPPEGAATGRWAVNVVGVVRGRSWARPPLAVGLALLHPIIRVGYRKALDDMAANASRDFAALVSGSPSAAAEAALKALYAPPRPGRPGSELTPGKDGAAGT